jgi:hypothetical protein
VRSPSPLEGRWTTTSAWGGLTLVIRNNDLRVWLRDHQLGARLLDHRWISVRGDRLHVYSTSEPAEVATYAWHLEHRQLTFRLVEQTPDASSLLAGLVFRAAPRESGGDPTDTVSGRISGR